MPERGHYNLGSNNGMWKGENVGYGGLHDWVKRHISKPINGMCEICDKVPYSDLANVTGVYNRDFANWQFQCLHHNPKSSQNLVPHSLLLRDSVTGRFISLRGGD